jgi:murein DD-endopeptidase MepM/ murein hydrolase activator NlpD
VPVELDAPIDVSADVATNSHVDRSGHLVVYEHIPLRQDLPGDYGRYEYPVAPWHGRTTVSSGYDLGRPDALQRRGAELTAVGHGGLDLPQDRGAPVRAIALRGQTSEPEVLYVGPLFGNTVLLRYLLREGASLRSYLALYGHLDGAAPGLLRGQTVAPGTVVGFVGDSGAIGLVHLHYEVRLVRPGVDPERVQPPPSLLDQEVSVPCDPRNVLPLRPDSAERPPVG